MKKIFNRKFSLKLLLTIITLYAVYNKINLHEVTDIFEKVSIWCFVVAFVTLFLAQIVSSYRMQYYYATAGLDCSNIFSIKLFFVSMFYNIIFPGGVGGDGYKIYIMSKLYNLPKLTSLRLAFANRFNGLAVLVLFLGVLSVGAESLDCYIKDYLLIMSLICFIGYFIMAKLVLKEDIKTALGAIKYSFLVQLLGIVSAGFLLYGVLGKIPHIDYFIIFLISSILSILPISIGGAGIREISFIYGAEFFNIDPQVGVAFSFAYFLINFILSLVGGVFVNKVN